MLVCLSISILITLLVCLSISVLINCFQPKPMCFLSSLLDMLLHSESIRVYGLKGDIAGAEKVRLCF